jgi:hypothetical protein
MPESFTYPLPLGSPRKDPLRTSPVPIRATCPAHLIHLDLIPRIIFSEKYRGVDKSLARRTSRCILFDGENILFDASLVIHINSTNIPPIVIIKRIYEHQNLLPL